MLAIIRLTVHKVHARWRGWAVLAVLTGLAGGVVLTAAAGALRTDSAYPRFLRQFHASDVLVSPVRTGLGGYDAALARLPGTAAVGDAVGINAVPLTRNGTVHEADTVAAADGQLGHTIEVPKILAGRLPGANSPGEVAVDNLAARQLHLHVGSTLRMAAFSNATPPRVRRLTEHVVGVFVNRGSIVPVTELDQVATVLASFALFRELGPAYEAFDGAFVKLSPGVSLERFGEGAQRLAMRFKKTTGGQAFIADESIQAAAVERAIRPQAVALALFAVSLALCALLIIGQVTSRLLIAAAEDNGALAALGMTRRQLLVTGLLEVLITATGGGALAVAFAIAASPLMPIGPARLAEPDPGISVNGAVLGIGFVAIPVLLLARVAVTAWRQASARPAVRVSQPSQSRSRAAGQLARAGAPITVVTGVRLALDPGYGRTSVPVRSALAGLAVAVAAVAVAVTFGANLLRLVDTPRLYGQDWDAALELQFGTVTPATFDKLTAHVPGIAGWTFGVHGTIGIGKTVIPAIGLAPGRGPIMSSTVLDGRPPASDDEIVLGSSVLRQFGLAVGQNVHVTTADDNPRAERITGTAVFPNFGQGSFTPTDVGEGAETTASLLAAQASSTGSGGGYNFVLVRFTPGPRMQANIAAFKRAWHGFCASVQQSTCVITDQRPNTVNNYANIDATPQVLAGVLALLGLGALVQFTLASARRRRRDFAMLKVLGMARPQLSSVMFWQVSTITVIALAVGTPLGIASGRWAWQLFANQAGLPGNAVTPLPLMWMIPLTLLLANLVALPTARGVARLGAAATLHSE